MHSLTKYIKFLAVYVMGKNFHSIQGTSEEIAFFTWSDVRFFPFSKKCYIRFFFLWEIYSAVKAAGC